MPISCSSLPIVVTNPPFDYRSQRFEDDARQLARWTSAPLDTCREQLFMAEGDLVLARLLVEQGYDALGRDSDMH